MDEFCCHHHDRRHSPFSRGKASKSCQTLFQSCLRFQVSKRFCFRQGAGASILAEFDGYNPFSSIHPTLFHALFLHYRLSQRCFWLVHSLALVYSFISLPLLISFYAVAIFCDLRRSSSRSSYMVGCLPHGNPLESFTAIRSLTSLDSWSKTRRFVVFPLSLC